MKRNLDVEFDWKAKYAEKIDLIYQRSESRVSVHRGDVGHRGTIFWNMDGDRERKRETERGGEKASRLNPLDFTIHAEKP